MSDPGPYALKRPHARLDWSADGPVAPAAGDVYFSAQDGLAESRAVFLAGAGFPERFNTDLTVIGELGFGTGLNFLAAWDMFRRRARAGARLHFVSVEGFPLRREDARRALAAFPGLAALSAQLVEAWPSAHKGAHRRVFEEGQVILTVFHDEADAALAEMDFAADAWFLDGFAPSKNPDMWTPDICARIARLSKPGARAATFTVAGAVRRGLAEAGFSVDKKPGFGRKRERLEAVFTGESAEDAPTPFPPPAKLDGPVAVIGGGIAAAALCEAFARRGRDVTVFAEGGWASGASGGLLGLFTPRLEAADRAHNRALLAAFDYARALYQGRAGFEETGVLRLAKAGESDDRLKRLAALLDEDFEWRQAQAGLWMARAGVFDPGALVRALAGDRPVRDARVAGLERMASGWRLADMDGAPLGEFAGVVLAGGQACAPLLAGSGIALEAVAGRVGVFDCASAPAAPAAWGGYAAPCGDAVLIGATHERGEDPGSQQRSEALLRKLAGEGPAGLRESLGAMRAGWGGVRAALPDRLPAAGPLPDESFDAVWSRTARGGPVPSIADQAPGSLFMLGGLGARGFAHAPLLAELIVSALHGEPVPLERAGVEALHPARFRWRALRRA